MLTNLIEELDNASKSIDIVSNTISDTELIIFTVRRRDWGMSDRNSSNAPACRNIWLAFEFNLFNLNFINY